MKFWTLFVTFLLFSSTLGFAINGGNETSSDFGRISGGAAVTNPAITLYPWMVAIVRNTNPPGTLSYWATGVAVSQHWVLTSGFVATYAKDNAASDEIVVKFDSADVSVGCTTCLERRIVNGLPHPSYVASSLVSNIGLCKVCPFFPTTMTYAPLPATPPTISAGATGISLGWQGGGDLQTALRALQRTVEVDATCSGGLSSAVADGNTWETTNFCTVFVTNHGTCNGDRGGPFVMMNEVVAVLDASGCRTVNTDTYTKLDAAFLTWINANK